ncbi:peroxidasin-like [Lamellibrachia satsuma]|nr:peroxidasin-like [Lamellibrachia satsuma]
MPPSARTSGIKRYRCTLSPDVRDKEPTLSDYQNLHPASLALDVSSTSLNDGDTEAIKIPTATAPANGNNTQVTLSSTPRGVAAGAADTMSVLSPGLLSKILREIPSFVDHAMRLLQDTIHEESARAYSMRHNGKARQGRPGRASFRFLLAFLGSSPYAKQLSYPAFVQTRALQLARERYRLNNAQVYDLIAKAGPILGSNVDVFEPDSPYPRPTPSLCPYPVKVNCNPYAIYRTYDGTCNNLRYPLRGSSNKPLARLLPPLYGDGIAFPRLSTSGSLLPSARLVSATIHWDRNNPHHIYTVVLMSLGQFIDHDISRTAVVTLEVDDGGYGEEMEDVDCGFDGCQTDGLENQACLPIPIPYNDTVFGGGRKPCLMFVRSQQVPSAYTCQLSPPEQLNQVTSYIDASHVYGSTKKETMALRDLQNPSRGRLRMTPSQYDPRYQDLLPQDPKFKMCKFTSDKVMCFAAGDNRVNEHVGLMCMHTLLAREHNRVESVLHYLNRHWGGQRLFEESRRIVVAEWQHVIYEEWLPIILGERIMRDNHLTLVKQGHWNGYNAEVATDVFNSFATAAFRFGHSLIQGMFHAKDNNYNSMGTVPLSMLGKYDNNYNSMGTVPLSMPEDSTEDRVFEQLLVNVRTYRDPRTLYNKPEYGMDALVAGLVGINAQTRDAFITKEVTNHLFAEEPPHGLGEDLMSLNIQRGRDHGLPGYNYFRQACGLRRAYKFEDLANELPRPIIERFRRLYSHVDDIDLWPAGISEYSVPDGLVGPTFACIIAKQFRRLKMGDRFWHENNADNPYPFTSGQLAEIRKASFAKLFCNNMDSFNKVQPRIFLHPLSTVLENIKTQRKIDNLATFNRLTYGSQNERVPCEALPGMDLGAWREHRQ